MNNFTKIEKYAIINILSCIMKADGVIDPKEEDFMNHIYSSFAITITSNPQPIGFRGNLLVKRPKFFYCTYSLGITETS